MDDVLRLLGTIMAVGATGAFGTFVVWYAGTTWKDTPMGRHLMAFMSVECVVLLYVLFANFIEVPAGVRLWVRFLSFGAVAAVGWWRVWLALKTQRAGREGRLPPGPKYRK